MTVVPPPWLKVLHEDEDLLVVDKPARLVCHPSKDGPASSLIGRTRLHLGSEEGRLVNRLDRETSGAVVIARNREVASALGRAFARGAVTKRYLAIVHGHVDDETEVSAPLGRDESSPVAIKDCVRADGAPALTRVRVLRHLTSDAAGPLSLVDVQPASGRKHQIRINLAHVGPPIVGDKIYGGDERRYLRFIAGELSDDDRRALVVGDHLLHALDIGFEWRGAVREWRAPVPERFHQFAGGRIEA